MSPRRRKKIKKWLGQPRTRWGIVLAGMLIIATLASLPLGRLFVARAAEASAKTYRLEPSQCDGWPDSGHAKKMDLSPNAALPEFSVKNSSSFYNRPASETDAEVVSTSDTTPTVTTLDCGKFTAPKGFPGDAKIANAHVIFSLGADTYQDNEDVLTLAYSLDGKEWTTLDSFALLEDVSNKTHGGHWNFLVDELSSRENIEKLQVRVEYHALPASEESAVFVDGAVVELEAAEGIPEPEFPSELVKLNKATFKYSEQPIISVAVAEPAPLALLGAPPKTRTVKAVRITSPAGVTTDLDYDLKEKQKGQAKRHEYTVKTANFSKPGRYTLTFEIEQDGQVQEVTQEFMWGVLVMNTMKSVYRPGEKVHFGMGVLDSGGRTICDAKLELKISDPEGKQTTLTTENGAISRSETCGPQTVTNLPDYAADFTAGKAGEYPWELKATTEAGEYTITDTLYVEETVLFDITRLGPTRIYPPADYEMFLEVVPEQDYTGMFEEFVPASFAVSGVNEDGSVEKPDDVKQIIRWLVDWKAGQPYTLSYTFDAPDISPELFLLGPAKVGEFTERRQWQIAADADITIDAGAVAATSHGMRSTVFTSATQGYYFFIDSDNDFFVSRTTDGGQTWGNVIEIDDDTTTTVILFDVWFDQWTPGGSGTLIHIWWLETGDDTVVYRTLDTSSDTKGTQYTVSDFTTSTSGRYNFVSGAKMRGGNLYCAFNADGGTTIGTYRSTDGGGTWGVRTNLVEATSGGDQALLFPGYETDTNDMWALYDDISADVLTLKMHDDSANSNSESATTIPFVEDSTEARGQYGFSGTIRHSDGHLLAVTESAYDAAGSDMQTWDINGTGSITQKGAISTNVDDQYHPSIFIDQGTNKVFAAYIGKRDGLEDISTPSAGAYYTTSTDGMANWTTGDTAYSATASDWRQTWAPLMGPRFLVAWRDVSSQALLTNYDNSVTFESAFTQNYYRFYEDNDLITPTVPWASLLQNAPITTSDSPPDDDGRVRIRMSVQVSGAALAATSQAFRLEYAERSDGVCSSATGWAAVDAASGSGIWRGESDGSPADGATLSSTVLDPSDRVESYEEQNDSVSNPTAIAAGEDGEWDWLIQNNGAVHDTTYCFRMTAVVGGVSTPFTAYTNYPKISTEVTTFNSSFEGGNGENFTKPYSSSTVKVSFNSELDAGGFSQDLTKCPTDQRKQNWFYFSMNNALNQTLEFTLINAVYNNPGNLTAENSDWVDHEPVYSYDDGITWNRIPTTGSLSGTYDWKYTFPKFTEGDTVLIAHGLPYTYANSETDIATWDDSSYVTVTDIGNSEQGRMMHLLTIQDADSPVAPGDKKVYWFVARQHPMEPMGSYAIKGVVDFLIGGSDEAKLMRRSSIFKIVPMMNPDGASLGYTTSNTEWCNLNREWESEGPNATTEAAEVYNAHYAMNSWMTGSPLPQGDAEVMTDVHTRCADPGIFTGNAAYDGNREQPYELLWQYLDGNDHNDEFTPSATVGLFNKEIYDEYYATKGTEVFNTEGTTYDFTDHTYPTAENVAAHEVAYLKTIWAMKETNAKVFGQATTDPDPGDADPGYFAVTAPGQYTAIFNEDKGGGLHYWWDRENDPYFLTQLVDDIRPLDESAWVYPGPVNLNTLNTTNAALTVANNTGTRLRFNYAAQFDEATDVDYVWDRTIWADGRSWQSFAVTNNTGSPIDWGLMAHQVSIDDGLAASFDYDYDDNVDPPTAGTHNWWGEVGVSPQKAVALAYYVGQTGGWVYNDYVQASDTQGERSDYRMTDGPSQDSSTTITTYLEYQIRPDLDLMYDETTIDEWRNDIANPDTPTMTTGTFTEFDKQEGGLEFAASGNDVKFTYNNATTYTKKKPVYVTTNYTASTAPVLKINDAYLDSETGEAHPSATHIGTSYTSWVDDANNIAYVQYLSDISTNINVEMKDTFAVVGITIDGKAYSDDDETTSLNGASVCVAVDSGAGSDCDATNASGEFTITGVNATSGGEQLTFFIDGGTTFGNTVTTGDGSDIVTGDNLRVYQNHVVVRYETGSTLAITGMDAYDNDQNPTDMLFDAEDSSPDTLSVEGTNELFVQSGYTFTPGGNVTASHDIEIDGTWTAATGETVALSGTYKLDTGGTLNPSTSTITFNATSGTEDLITTGTGSLYNLTLDDSAGSLTVRVQDPLDINGTLTITGGTLDVVTGESNQINIAGNWANSDIFEAQSGTVVADGTTQQTFSGNLTGSSAFNNLIITNYSGADPDATPSVIFSASASTDATFTATTADTKLRFLASGTYTFQNVSFNGQADTTRVALRSSTGGTDWNLNVAGTRTVLNTNAKDSDACGQAPDIDGTHPSNYDATGNFCWTFYSLTFDASDNTIGFGSLTSANARFATGNLSGSDAKVSGHNLQATTTYTGGYTIKYLGATLTSGGDTIDYATIVDDDNGDPGNFEQFALGVTTDGDADITSGYDAASPADYKFVPSVSTTIISETGATALETISVYYLGNIVALTEAGTYASDITYTMTANF